MIVAELKGKIPSRLESKEDILTSNIFSFFKYTNRRLLQLYLHRLAIDVSLRDATQASFEFWPIYEDGTEPDLVIKCGKYYILFEAKLYSDFAPKTSTTSSQIVRELTMGKLDAANEEMEFIYVAITAEYYKDVSKYRKFEKLEKNFIWTNWQFVTEFLENELNYKMVESDYHFGLDVYKLLLKKKLRSFIGFSQIQNNLKSKTQKGDLFYNLSTSRYKGAYTGFIESLIGFKKIHIESILNKRAFFDNLPNLNIVVGDNTIYYE